MADYNSNFEAILKGKIEDGIGTHTHHLSVGFAASFEDYRERVGKIMGLREALALIEDTHKLLHGNDEKTKERL